MSKRVRFQVSFPQPWSSLLAHARDANRRLAAVAFETTDEFRDMVQTQGKQRIEQITKSETEFKALMDKLREQVREEIDREVFEETRQKALARVLNQKESQKPVATVYTTTSTSKKNPPPIFF